MNNNNANQNKLSGRYEIIEQIGIGGMSYVYKAFDSKRKKIVAIKILKDELSLDPEFVEKFKSEALSCKDIRHENVISAFDVVDEEKMHYIVMEYVDGTTLNKYIKDKGKLSNEETIKIAIQVAKGIQAAHKKGIIHRDIKPQNIVINDKNLAKITDFGIARAITSTTRNISVVGTVHYISPEQVRNTTVDFRSDIYSFGCTLYEMITGVVPFKGDTPLEIIISHLRENIKAPHLDNPLIYKSLEKIILKATRMIPRERYQGIEEMIADLEKALKDKEGTYITDSIYDDDEEGKTVIINDEDMKVIKQVSSKFANVNSYQKETNELTPEQKEFFDRYIKNGAFKQHMLMRKLIIAAIACVAVLAIATIVITIDTRKQAKNVTVKNATVSEVFVNLKDSLEGIDFELAKSLATDYGLIFNVVGEEYSDTVGYGKIIRIEKDNSDVDKSLDIVLSKGGINLDFTNKEELQKTKWTDMLVRLNERGLKYSVSEISDQVVPRGYIIGVNKETSDQSGSLVFTVSKGLSEQIKIMPDLYMKPIAEVRELLEANELVIGDISFLRDYVVEENCVTKQSVEKGVEVKSGTSIDLTLSCGPDGVEYIAEKKEKWYGELSATYKVVRDNSPNVSASDTTMILQVRLMQKTSEGVIYTELMEPQEYKIGTIVPLMFTSIEGEAKVQNGQVQVVDVVNDVVVSSIDVMFWPKKE